MKRCTKRLPAPSGCSLSIVRTWPILKRWIFTCKSCATSCIRSRTRPPWRRGRDKSGPYNPIPLASYKIHCYTIAATENRNQKRSTFMAFFDLQETREQYLEKLLARYGTVTLPIDTAQLALPLHT